MGHTGIIIEATFSLIPIQSSFMKVDTFKFEDLDSLMDCMIDSDKKYRYSVAWIDSLNKKGRGVLTCGEHANFEDLNEKQKINPLNFDFSSGQLI